MTERQRKRDRRDETNFKSSLPDRSVSGKRAGGSDEDPIARAIPLLATDLATALDDAHSIAFLERVVTEVPLGRVRDGLRRATLAPGVRNPRAYFAALMRRELPGRRHR